MLIDSGVASPPGQAEPKAALPKVKQAEAPPEKQNPPGKRNPRKDRP